MANNGKVIVNIKDQAKDLDRKRVMVYVDRDWNVLYSERVKGVGKKLTAEEVASRKAKKAEKAKLLEIKIAKRAERLAKEEARKAQIAKKKEIDKQILGLRQAKKQI